MEGTPVGRRVFLGIVGVGAVGVLWGAKAQDWLERVVAPIVSKDGTGLSAFLPIGRFRIYTVTGDLPSKSKAAWRLKVGGLVDKPFTLTYDELRAMPATRMTTGLPVRHRLARARRQVGRRAAERPARPGRGASPRRKALRFKSFDGTYTESLTLSQARRNDVIVAYQMEGGDISAEHGGPVRLVRGADVRLQVVQVAGHASTSPTRWSRATGSTTATTSTDGSGRSNGRDDDPTS